MRTSVSTQVSTVQQPSQAASSITLAWLKKIAIAIGMVLLAAAPAIAEQPWPLHTVTQQNNIRRLQLLNECIGCDLMGVTLAEEHLIGADLRDADLKWVNFSGSNLEGADLSGADLTGADFTGAFLTNTILADTQMVLVDFTDAHLYSVDVTGATMRSLELSGADIFNTPISVGGPEDSLPTLPSDVD